MRSWECLSTVLFCDHDCCEFLLAAGAGLVEPLDTPLGVLAPDARCVMGFVPCHAFGAGFLLERNSVSF